MFKTVVTFFNCSLSHIVLSFVLRKLEIVWDLEFDDRLRNP